MYGSAIIAVAVVIFMLIKKMDIKITLFLMGILLMFIGMAMGNGCLLYTSPSPVQIQTNLTMR